MSIDLSKYAEGIQGDVPILRKVCKELRKPLSYKIRDSKVVAKGGRKFPTIDLTRFVVRSYHGDNGVRATSGRIEPIWDTEYEIKSGDVVVNLLPLIAYGIPVTILLCERMAGHIVQNPSTYVSTRNSDTQKVESDIEPEALNECMFLVSNMLTNVVEVASKECLECAQQICKDLMLGADTSAASLLSIINNNDLLSTCFMFMTDILSSNDPDLGSLGRLYEYKKGRSGVLAITNTERACISLTCIWVVHLFRVLRPTGIPVEFDEIYEILQMQFFKSLGNDEVGIYIRTGVHIAMQKTIKGASVSRNEMDNCFLFNELYGCTGKRSVCGDVHVYSVDHFKVVKEYLKAVRKNTDAADLVKRNLEVRDKLYSDAQAKISSLEKSAQEFDTTLEQLRSEKDADIKQLSYENDRLKNRIRQLEEELSVLKSNALAYYSDDTSDGGEIAEAGSTQVSIEECVDNINQYSIMVAGGEPTFMDKLSKYGVTSVNQFYDMTRMPVGTRYDFYCIYTKFIAHKSVFFLQSHFETGNCLFYFNGTNVEAFIRAANDFINKWFE